MSHALPYRVALVGETARIEFSELARVAAALSLQVQRDFAPKWHVVATVDPFPSGGVVPAGYWPIYVRDDIDEPGAAGYHADQNNTPYALVDYEDPSWSLTASHELLEMLADPWGNRRVASRAIRPGTRHVEYLVEVCDPSEDANFAYEVNGVQVSDFYTPRYFDWVQTMGVLYSFTGAIKKPREVLRGGYLSWFNLENQHVEQLVWFGSRPRYRDLGRFDAQHRSMRAFVDRNTIPTNSIGSEDE